MKKENNNLANEILSSLNEVKNHLEGNLNLTSRVAKVPETPNIKDIRKKLGYTQNEFANHFGFSLKSIQEWEQGRRNPERSSRILLAIIDQDPSVVEKALGNFNSW